MQAVLIVYIHTVYCIIYGGFSAISYACSLWGHIFPDERERFSLPDDMPVVHFEYTQFYYPGGLDFPRKYKVFNEWGEQNNIEDESPQ